MATPDEVVHYAIHPCIGVARVGNAPDEFLLAPEAPGQVADAGETYKDSAGRMKRQAARFRVYGYDAAGNAVREITADDAEVVWRVHVANRKAVWYQFNNAMDLGTHAREARRRNEAVQGDGRRDLVIDPGVRAIAGRGAGGDEGHRFDTGRFFGRQVYLGEIRTDDRGRLLVLGGRGDSRHRDPGARPTTFANNDLWHDDTSDGTVRATVRVGGREYQAEPAAVAVVPPNYGPGLYGPVTMYDVVTDLFRREFGLPGPARPSFWRDIFPLFDRIVRLQWANDGAHFLFGPGSPSDLTAQSLLDRLSDPAEAARPARAALFRRFREPGDATPAPGKLPPFYGDGYDEVVRDDPARAGSAGLAVTRTQYDWLRRWADGDFDSDPADRAGPPAPLDAYPAAAQPGAVDRAHLEDCLGGPFHPGIELTWTLRAASMWGRPFRLNLLPEGVEPPDDYGEVLEPARAVAPGGVLDGTGPGTLTRWLGVPWQTDEASCHAGYQVGTYLPAPSFWAARVPNHVLSGRAYGRVIAPGLPDGQRLKHFHNRQEWLRFFGPSYLARINDNVTRWFQAGILAERPGPGDTARGLLPDRMWVETEVDPSLTANDPTWDQLMAAEDAAAAPPAFGAVRAAAAPGGTDDATPGHARRTLGRGEL